MPLIWGEVTGVATAIPGVDLGVVMAAAGYVIITGILYWYDTSQPPAPYGVALAYCSDTGSGGGGGSF